MSMNSLFYKITEEDSLTLSRCVLKFEAIQFDSIRIVKKIFFNKYQFECNQSVASEILLRCRSKDKCDDNSLYLIMDEVRNERYGSNPTNKKLSK